MMDAKWPPGKDRDCGRGSERPRIDLGRELLVILGRHLRECERSHEQGEREAERRFPFIGVAQNLGATRRAAALRRAIPAPSCLMGR